MQSFWGGWYRPNPVNEILDRDDFTLEDLLDEEEILQTCRSRASDKLSDYLTCPENLSRLLNYALVKPTPSKASRRDSTTPSDDVSSLEEKEDSNSTSPKKPDSQKDDSLELESDSQDKTETKEEENKESSVSPKKDLDEEESKEEEVIDEKVRYKYPHVSTEVLCTEALCPSLVNDLDSLFSFLSQDVSSMEPHLAANFIKITKALLSFRPSAVRLYARGIPTPLEDSSVNKDDENTVDDDSTHDHETTDNKDNAELLEKDNDTHSVPSTQGAASATSSQHNTVKHGGVVLVERIVKHFALPGMDEVLMLLMGFEAANATQDLPAYPTFPDEALIGLPDANDSLKRMDEIEDARLWWSQQAIVTSLLDRFTGSLPSNSNSNSNKTNGELNENSSFQEDEEEEADEELQVNISNVFTDVLKRFPATFIAKEIASSDSTSSILSCILRGRLHGLGVLSTLLEIEELHSSAISVVVSRLSSIVDLLRKPPSLEPQLTTAKKTLDPPLGPTRLRLVSFLLSIVKTKSPLAQEALIESSAIDTVLDLFFKYDLNNILHNIVDSVITEIMDQPNLLSHLIHQCHLSSKIIAADKESRLEQSKPNGMALGYSGHLSTIAQRLNKNDAAKELLSTDLYWEEYTNEVLSIVQRLEEKQLGGPPPKAPNLSEDDEDDGGENDDNEEEDEDDDSDKDDQEDQDNENEDTDEKDHGTLNQQASAPPITGIVTTNVPPQLFTDDSDSDDDDSMPVKPPVKDDSDEDEESNLTPSPPPPANTNTNTTTVTKEEDGPENKEPPETTSYELTRFDAPKTSPRTEEEEKENSTPNEN